MSTLKANTISNVAGSQSISTDRVAQGAAFAWVNFNGTGTIAIRQAYNVSSLTDNGVGDYTLNFTTAAVDANYAVVGVQNSNVSSSGSACRALSPLTLTSSTARVVNVAGTGAAEDSPTTCVALFR